MFYAIDVQDHLGGIVTPPRRLNQTALAEAVAIAGTLCAVLQAPAIDDISQSLRIAGKLICTTDQQPPPGSGRRRILDGANTVGMVVQVFDKLCQTR